MPNQSGNTKRKKRNERLEKAKAACIAESVPCVGAALEASTGDDGESSESKRASCFEASTCDDGGLLESNVDPEDKGDIGPDDEKNKIEPEEEKKNVKKKKKKKKKKTSQSDEISNDIPNEDVGTDNTFENDGTVVENENEEKREIEESSKVEDSCDKHVDGGAVQFCDEAATGDKDDVGAKNEIEQGEEKKTAKKKKKKRKKSSQGDKNSNDIPNEEVGTDDIFENDAGTVVEHENRREIERDDRIEDSRDIPNEDVTGDILENDVTVVENEKKREIEENSNVEASRDKDDNIDGGAVHICDEKAAGNVATDACFENIGSLVTVKNESEAEDTQDSNLEDSTTEHDDEVITATDVADENAVYEEAVVEEAVVEEAIVQEKRNFAILTRLLMGVGGDCLRQYFKSIHTTWSNMPTDASSLKKGALKLQNHELAIFYTGDINKWDVALLIRVLRFSAVSSAQLKRYPDKDDALRSIQEIRNKFVAHAKDERLSGSDFQIIWKDLKQNLLTIGADEESIDATLTDHTQLGLEQYLQLFLEEIALRKFAEQAGEKRENCSSTEEVGIVESNKDPPWDSWLKFYTYMNSFTSSQTQYVLLADVMAPADLLNFKVLAAVPWKMVIDFNPSSEDDGLYKAFNSQTNLQRIISPFTPGEIAKAGYLGLPKQIDSKRTQWLFANGRKEDTDDSKPKSFPDWERQSVMCLSMFFAYCAGGDMFDKQKPIRCLLLPLSKETPPFVEVTLTRLIENFLPYDLSFACIDNSYDQISVSKQIDSFQLSSDAIKNGVGTLFNVTEDLSRYEMPCFQSGIRIPFSQRDYVYMTEYLELFYMGCQSKYLDVNYEEEEQQEVEEEHKKGFLSGNQISFLSLYFNHDAKREIEKDIEIHVQRMLNQTIKQSSIVQIAHPPGTGGSTIARRVLWNLHESFPCASVRVSSRAEFDEDSSFIHELSSRISILEDKCGIPPVVLIDGHRQWRIHALSNRIVRTLNSRGKRAVILECHRGSKPHANADVHKVFNVDARLEDSSADLREFKEKFQISDQPARRVFHFPLLSMINEFRERLEEIVTNTLNELDDVEKDIAAFVAFLQLYADQPTPAILLYEVFQSRLSVSKGVQVTYESIKECFSGSLLNIMVHQRKRGGKEDCLTHYTLQHHVVATILFEKYLEIKKTTLYKYVYEFLQCKVSNIKKFVALYCDLFLFNRGGNRKLRFSVVIDELKMYNEKEAAAILRKAAELIPDPRGYGHAARFYAKMRPPKFKDAEELIAAGIKLSESHGRVKSIQDSKGVVLSLILKHNIRRNHVKDIASLEEMAQKALDAFRAARDFPPTFPSPLIGEVDVWILCIEWITRNHSGDAAKAVDFIVNRGPPFFRTCIGDSFYLLELVDKMVLSLTMIADPDDIRDRAHKFRMTLLTAVRPGFIESGHRRNLSDALFEIDHSMKLPQTSRKELKRIRTRLLLSSYLRDQQSFKYDENMKELVKLLEDMVSVEKDFSFGPHFLQLCLLGYGPGTYNLERGWKVCRDLLEQPDSSNPMIYYYSMVIAFVQILNGLGPDGYFAEYKSLVQKLKDASRGHCRRNQSLHFLKKNGCGISQLISHQSLLSDESSYKADNPDVVKSFWTVDSRRKLKECTGRLRVRVEGSRKVTSIELLEGDIELYVGKYAEIGTPGKDFDKGTKVYFVVSFNMRGPVANGITFHPVPSNTNAAARI